MLLLLFMSHNCSPIFFSYIGLRASEINKFKKVAFQQGRQGRYVVVGWGWGNGGTMRWGWGRDEERGEGLKVGRGRRVKFWVWVLSEQINKAMRGKRSIIAEGEGGGVLLSRRNQSLSLWSKPRVTWYHLLSHG